MTVLVSEHTDQIKEYFNPLYFNTMTKLNSTPPGGDKLNKVNSSPVK